MMSIIHTNFCTPQNANLFFIQRSLKPILIFVSVCSRYPKETMEVVEELAFGIVQEYRESQKGRLQRTFVSSKDAAEAKVNRGKAKTS